MAEGALGAMGDVDPEAPAPTSRPVSPADEVDRLRNAAETGLISAVELHNEGLDDGESQDAARPTEEVKSATAKSPQMDAIKGKEYRVLIVEDTTELAEVIEATLSQMNMTTFHETHGNRAVATLKDQNPDIVLLDIGLPDMTGWDIMDAIKAHHEAGARMPIIIVITAYDDPANRLVGKLQGVQGYLIKPFTPDEIQHTVVQAITSGTPG